MFKKIIGLFGNLGIIISFLFAMGDDKFHKKSDLIPKIGLVISCLTFVLRIVDLFHHDSEMDKDERLLEKLF